KRNFVPRRRCRQNYGGALTPWISDKTAHIKKTQFPMASTEAESFASEHFAPWDLLSAKGSRSYQESSSSANAKVTSCARLDIVIRRGNSMAKELMEWLEVHVGGGFRR